MRNAVPINVYLIIAIVIFIISVIATALILTFRTPKQAEPDARIQTQHVVCADDDAGYLLALPLTETEDNAQ